jgi:hypothetical protein
MYISRINRALYSLVIGVAILLGSTGFVIQTHECQHSGSKVYVMVGHAQQENICCDQDDLRSCESETDHYQYSCGNPDILSSEPCCEHKVQVVQLPGFTISDKNIEKNIPLIAGLPTIIPALEIRSSDISIYRPFNNKHGGKDLLILNCQSLT